MAYASWLTPSKKSGSGNDSVSFSATAFTGRENRTTVATITTTSGGTVTAELNVTQTNAGNLLTITQPSTVAAAGATIQVTGTSNASKLNVEVTGTGFTLSKLEVEIDSEFTEQELDVAIPGDPGAVAQYNWRATVVVTKNATVSTRTAEFKVTPGEGTEKSVTISQTAGNATLTITPTAITIPAAGTAQTVQVTSNTSWSIS